MTRVLLKVGGSLLVQPNLAMKLREFALLRPGESLVFLVGGGAAVDVVRGWDRGQGLGDEAAHDLALGAMGLNEQLLLALMPEMRLVRSLSQLEMLEGESLRVAEENTGRASATQRQESLQKHQKMALVCAECFCRWGEQATGRRLPRSWDLTSDAIAAWVAGLIGARELVLLKSMEWEVGISWGEAARRGWVDFYFERFLPSGVKVSWGHGRAEQSRLVDCSTSAV